MASVQHETRPVDQHFVSLKLRPGFDGPAPCNRQTPGLMAAPLLKSGKPAEQKVFF
jgi:hypothetical protein